MGHRKKAGWFTKKTKFYLIPSSHYLVLIDLNMYELIFKILICMVHITGNECDYCIHVLNLTRMRHLTISVPLKWHIG